ncbi:cell division cycle-related protein res2/pct1 [Podospora australis]|uniref:Cell division cycle-related protein res2/pct1 n=1 Tax=Podospora australis TaxID=1536484 RepID=A0AAN7AGB7_9PEZI|nr:cell division cycle-related protein res2/pct1 [Podospora australis]
MRRRQDNWINATHILKAAGFDKPARTRILEREVQKDTHEKIQGGYGKYQGTWIPLEQGEALAQRNNIYEQLKPIFEYEPGAESPPPAPRHASRPKAPKAKPAVPKWGSKAQEKKNNLPQVSVFAHPVHHQPAPIPQPEEYDTNADSQMHEDDTPDNLTVASASYMAEDDRGYDMSHYSTGHRKRKRDEFRQDMAEQQHAMYGDELLDYFLLSTNNQAAIRPDPPTNFQPDWPIDTDQHTSLHWASSMGDTDVIKQLKKFGANLLAQNLRGETPLMRAVGFTNCYARTTFPTVLNELFSSVDAKDHTGSTVIHHAAIMKSGRVASTSCARYYLDNILNKLAEVRPPDEVQALIDAQDNDGNTALHLAAKANARKCIRSLLGRGASTDIPNNEGVRAEEIIKELNTSTSAAHAATNSAHPQRSSSPFAPDSQRRPGFTDALAADSKGPLEVSYVSEAASTVQSRITPLVLQKLQDLSQSYDNEFNEKDEAEKEARRILVNTQGELTNLRASIADMESRIESDEAAARVEENAKQAREKVLVFVIHQNRLAVQEYVSQQLQSTSNNLPNGTNSTDGAKADGATDSQLPDGQQQQQQQEDDPEERLRLAAELRDLLEEQRAAEIEYVDARGLLGTGEKIDKYRHLLRSCLPPEDQEMLDQNLEDMISMMEDEAEVLGSDGGGGVEGNIGALVGRGEPMEITAI